MSMRSVTGLGAFLGARFALAYSLVFVVVGVVLYGKDLTAAPPDGSFWATYAAGAVSLAVAALGIALIMALVAAVLGAMTALCAAGLHRLLGKGAAGLRTVATGLVVAATFVILLHLLLWQAGLWSLSSFYSFTYYFWLGIPSILYLLAALLASRAYNRSRAQEMSAPLPTAAWAHGTIVAAPSSSGKEPISAPSR